MCYFSQQQITLMNKLWPFISMILAGELKATALSPAAPTSLPFPSNQNNIFLLLRVRVGKWGMLCGGEQTTLKDSSLMKRNESVLAS